MADLVKGGSSYSSLQVAQAGLGPPAPFLQCDPLITSGGSGVLADPSRIDVEFRKAWPALGKGRPTLRNSMRKLKGANLR